MSRFAQPAGWPGGSTVRGWSASTSGPSTASKRRREAVGEIQLLADSRPRAVTPSHASPSRSRAIVGGRTLVAMRRPM